MIVLGIETSCDETAASVVNDKREILSNVVLSQLEEHRAYGGVVPEIAARAHLEHLDRIIEAALQDAGLGFEDLDGVAATCGPGLIGGVMIGMMAAKAIAAAADIPFLAINHLEGHALTPRLTDDLSFPYLLLLVSGGHTQLLAVEGVGMYRRYGTTLDDAAGECFDKSAKLMGLSFPGGPQVEVYAKQCKDQELAIQRFELPRPMMHRKELDFSFSGLKTAVRNHVEALPADALRPENVADLCYAFQNAMAETIADRCKRALDRFVQGYKVSSPALVVAGGVAANMRIREALEDIARQKGGKLYAPPLNLCTDNGAMIAWAGIERLRLGLQDSLDFKARPRWPLDPNAAAAQDARVKT